MNTRTPVAKNLHKANRSNVHVDRKKNAKKGVQKHRNKELS
jgi:hypothetical protein